MKLQQGAWPAADPGVCPGNTLEKRNTGRVSDEGYHGDGRDRERERGDREERERREKGERKGTEEKKERRQRIEMREERERDRAAEPRALSGLHQGLACSPAATCPTIP